MLLRPWANAAFLKNGKNSIYCALYTLPILSLLHTVAGGLICECYFFLVVKPKIIEFLYKKKQFFLISDYAFPYLSVIISMVSNAAHFSMKLDQSMTSLIKTSVTEFKNTTIIGK